MNECEQQAKVENLDLKMQTTWWLITEKASKSAISLVKQNFENGWPQIEIETVGEIRFFRDSNYLLSNWQLKFDFEGLGLMSPIDSQQKILLKSSTSSRIFK